MRLSILNTLKNNAKVNEKSEVFLMKGYYNNYNYLVKLLVTFILLLHK